MSAPHAVGPVPLLPPDAPLGDWLAARREGIGGSDVAAVLGVSRYAGPTRVYYDKLGVLPDEDNAAMEWGRRLEAAVRLKFADEHPEFHVTAGPGLVAHPERPWQRATIDGLATESSKGEPIALVELKGLALDTPIPTPMGWSTIRDIALGDEVFDVHGNTCRVTGKSEIRWVDCYRMTFDDGTTIVCDADHHWPVVSGTSRRRMAAVLDTRTIARTIRGVGGQRQHRIMLARPVELPERELPVEPYTLGCWLGDGKHTDGSISKPDEELFDLIASASGLRIGQNTEHRDSHCTTRTVLGLRVQLRAAGVLGDKHIPDVYLRSSVEQRLALLCGLMDTDGTFTTSRKQAAFCSTDKQLALTVAELVLSLGERATVVEVNGRGFGRRVTSWRVVWRPMKWNPFCLTRKAELVGELGGRRSQTGRRMIASAEPIPTVPTQCISVDSPDRTYLCGDRFLPTHNTGRSGAEDWGDELTDEVPLPYVCQLTWYLDVYGLSAGYLAVLLDGRDYREYVIGYDPDLAAKLRAHCAAFWHNNVLTQVPPDPDGLADTAAVLDSLHRPKKKTKADLPAEVADWARIYGNAHQDCLRAKRRKQDAGNHIRAMFLAAGSPHEGWVDGRKVASYPLCGEPTKEITDWAALEADHPELVAQYRRPIDVEQERRLYVSKEFTT